MKRNYVRIPVFTIVLFFISDLAIAQDLTNGLVSVWELDETSGTTAVDAYGSNDGVNSNVTLLQPSLSNLNYSYEFDGATSQIVVSNGSNFSFDARGDSYSYSFWVKSSEPNDETSARIIQAWDGSSSYAISVQVRYDLFGCYIYDITSINSVLLSNPSAEVWDGAWHFVAFVCNTNVLTLYLDGSYYTQTNISITGTTETSSQLQFGNNYNNNRHFKGNIEQVAIWSRAITEAEISQLYNSGNGLPYSQWGTPPVALTGGEISPETLTINSGESPETISSVSDASGGNGTYTYQWQLSTDGSTFSDISGATGTSYTAPVLTQNTWYRRKVTDGASAEAYSNVSVIEVITSGGECLWNENAGYIYRNSKVSINTISDPGDYTLAVNGKIRAKEIKVDTDWADYVFDTDYRLKTLEEIESFIKENKHLPEIPTAQDVEKGGVDLGEMNMLLLKKVEELTLYIINQQKEINLLKSDLNNTKKED